MLMSEKKKQNPFEKKKDSVVDSARKGAGLPPKEEKKIPVLKIKKKKSGDC
jgi:hypothetical protein